jgi:hypothetical protein
MKRFIAFLSLVFLVSATSQAQVYTGALGGYQSKTVINNKTYANSQLDTSATYLVGGLHSLALRYQYGDSISVIFTFDYRTVGSTSWTAAAAAVGDTVINTGDAGFGQVVLRNQTTERIPGMATQVRVRHIFAGSANSANSGARYSTFLNYKQ